MNFKKLLFWSGFLLIILLLTVFLSLRLGPVNITFKKILESIFQRKETLQSSIIFNIRLPRIILGLAIGGSLSLAGLILQGLFRNPLVEPYTLGISGGAGLGICLAYLLRLNYFLESLFLPLWGFLGASIVILILYSLTLKKRIINLSNLLLIGVMISFISSSFIMLIMATTKLENLEGIIFWIMGSLALEDWRLIKLVFVLSLLGLGISYFFSLQLNALSLGEEKALQLGVNVERTKKILLILASLLTGISVSTCGIIGFVGLVVPHFVRIFLGSDNRLLLITSFLYGGIFLILSDTLARIIILPLELPVGVVTGIIGGGLFIYLLTQRKIYYA